MARVTTQADLHEELLSLYRRTGEATGYWAHYFLREVRLHGGLGVAKKLLGAGRVSSGFERLIEARRADLSIEAIAVSDRFKHLFSNAERKIAARRLAELPPSAFPSHNLEDPFLATDIPSAKYTEGTVLRVSVNRYERDAKARAACLRHHGTRCAVCALDFSERYGEIGVGFIHVHHKKPLSQLRPNYRLNPIKDLVPVCPNCHAMLHRREPPYDVEQLRAILRST